MQYPKWLYSKDKESKLVKSEDEHKALGSEWKESPAECEEKKPAKKKAKKSAPKSEE